MRPTRLSFFNEQDPPALTALVAREDVRAHLRALEARVTVGLRDLSPERASAIHQLTADGIGVDAWLLLPREHGYFATWDNHAHVEARVDDVRRWLDQHHLPLRTLGFDFEPDLRELDALFRAPVGTLCRWALRARDRRRRERALSRYRDLIERLRADGFTIESYQFPLLLEDRASGSDFLQRLTSSLDVPVDREVVMAYSSLLGPLGPGLVEGWLGMAPRAVAVGSTGGGVDPLPKLSFDALTRDLRLAARVCREVAIFSLEGCVEHGHLPRLRDLDWAAPVELPLHQRVGAGALRLGARTVARWLR